MSYPKRAKGWRSLTVNEQHFRWRLKIGAEGEGNSLHLQGATSSGRQVIVTLKGWFFLWDFVGNFGKLPNNPQVITGKFVAQAIKFALANGWHPEQSGPPIVLNYENDTAVLSQTIGEVCHSTVIDTTSKVEVTLPVFRQIYP